ncbi:MAG TPA: hypothetical protein VFJ43_13855 [Bacteroidia bacterium]|nr:hypothetical protein [Bacteroidia bacterium]
MSSALDKANDVLTTNIKLNENEAVVYEDRMAFHMKSKWMAEGGALYLTNQRLVFKKADNPFVGFVAKLFIKMAQAKVTHDIPLNSIKSLTKEKVMRTHNLILEYGNGEKATFRTTKTEKFEAELYMLTKIQAQVHGD